MPGVQRYNHDQDVVDVVFEIAPPGATGVFKPYVSGRIRRMSHDS